MISATRPSGLFALCLGSTSYFYSYFSPFDLIVVGWLDGSTKGKNNIYKRTKQNKTSLANNKFVCDQRPSNTQVLSRK
jgi:hypothetical protein